MMAQSDGDMSLNSHSIEQLEREWEVERKQYLIRTRGGGQATPRTFFGVVLLIGSVLGSAIVFQIAQEQKNPLFFVFGVVIFLVNLKTAIQWLIQAHRYRRAHELYLQRRAQFMVPLQ